jgi:hypothetical protein
MGENRLAIPKPMILSLWLLWVLRGLFQNLLQNNDSQSCNLPKPLSIRQDVPFMMVVDVIQYAQEEIDGVE